MHKNKAATDLLAVKKDLLQDNQSCVCETVTSMLYICETVTSMLCTCVLHASYRAATSVPVICLF